jgi:ATP-dependent protease ClpP protease subunit
LEGFKIISAILNSEIPVHTYNDGFAMSMGFFIWISAKKENRHMSAFATNMIHAARFVDENGMMVEPENADEGPRELLENQEKM